MTELFFEARALSCGYEGRIVLSNLSATIRPGEVVALLGPNGAGKSTLLNTVAKVLRPMGGTLLLSGDDVTSLSFANVARLAAFVPQGESTHFPFRAREIAMMGRLARSTGFLDTNEDRVVVDRCLERCGVLDLADRPIGELSGGERQRVLIARAFAQEAPLLVLDEPTAHLDLEHQLAVVKIVREHVEAGGAALMAIHDLNLAATVATRAWLLHDGRVDYDGSPTELLENPILESAFRVGFDRLRDSEGQVRVFPRSALSDR